MPCRPWRTMLRRSICSSEKALSGAGGPACLTLPLVAWGLCSPFAAEAACTVPGLWTDTYGGHASIASTLAGTMQLPYCAAAHRLTVSLAGSSGFTVDARYGGAGDCQGFAESLSFGADCKSASGRYTNDDGGTGPDTWTRTGPTIALSGGALTSITANGTPAGGVFGFTTPLLAGANIATVAQAAGFTERSNPDQITLTAPGGGGAPSPGGLERLVAKYTAEDVDATNDLNTIATFGLSCYMVALESDYGTVPDHCSSTRIGGVVYAGAVPTRMA